MPLLTEPVVFATHFLVVRAPPRSSRWSLAGVPLECGAATRSGHGARQCDISLTRQRWSPLEPDGAQEVGTAGGSHLVASSCRKVS